MGIFLSLAILTSRSKSVYKLWNRENCQRETEQVYLNRRQLLVSFLPVGGVDRPLWRKRNMEGET